MSKKSRYGRLGFPRHVGRHAVLSAPAEAVEVAAPATVLKDEIISPFPLDEDFDDDAKELDDDGEVFAEPIDEDYDVRTASSSSVEAQPEPDEIDGPLPEDAADADDDMVAEAVEEDPDEKPIMTKPLAPPSRPKPMFMHPKAPPSPASRFSPPPLRPARGVASATSPTRPGFLHRPAKSD